MKFKFSNYFTAIEINSLAISTGFIKRKPKKITPYNFIVSFLVLYNSRTYSLRNWASELSILINERVTFQAIHKKLTVRHLPFLSSLFSLIISSNLKSQDTSTEGLMSSFNRVLVEDSTCVKLADSMYDHYSGNSNGLCCKAISRIQVCLDLKSGAIVNSEITTYTRNDISYASEIVKRVEKNDLVIRDLGYWKVGSFKAINDQGAYYLSRLRNNVKLYTSDNQSFNLVNYLKSQDKKRVKSIELNLEIGGKEKIKVRIIGQKISTGQYHKRIKHAKTSRHKNSRISDNTMYLLNWSLLITNVDKQRLSQTEAYSLYGLRWEIEMFFKNWKSNYKIDKLLKTSKGADPIKPEILMYLSLINMACIYQPNFEYYRNLILKKYEKIVSPLKFAKFLKSIYLKNLGKTTILNRIRDYCCYDVRTDRVNMQQKLINMGLG